LDYLTIGDLFHPYLCGNGELSAFVNEELFKEMLYDILVVEYGFTASQLRSSYLPIKKVIVEEIELQLAGTKNSRFTLLSGHDITLVAFLSGLRYEGLQMPPPYASHLAVEIWQHSCCFSVRIVLNGEVLRIKERDLLPLSEFMQNEGEREL
jgi:hypothetical protein